LKNNIGLTNLKAVANSKKFKKEKLKNALARPTHLGNFFGKK